MEEAVEICKLRLFLKLVAQLDSYDEIEALPDIDGRPSGARFRTYERLTRPPSLEQLRDAVTSTKPAAVRV